MVYQAADFWRYGSSLRAQRCGCRGQPLCGVDQKILQSCGFRSFAADAGTGAALAAGGFLTLVAEHFVIHFITSCDELLDFLGRVYYG